MWVDISEKVFKVRGRWVIVKFYSKIRSKWPDRLQLTTTSYSTAWVQKQSPVHFTVVSTYVDRFLEYLTLWHTVYPGNIQHKSYWFAHLTYIMLLHYLREVGKSTQAVKRSRIVCILILWSCRPLQYFPHRAQCQT